MVRTMADKLLEFKNVSKVFQRSGFALGKHKTVKALDDVSIHMPDEPQILGLVGESGSGKTTMSRLVMGLESGSAGQVLYRGKNITAWLKEDTLRYRAEVQMIFQDPYGTYNPFYRVDRVLTSITKKFNLAQTDAEARDLINEALTAVGLRPKELLGRYPHQLSGGERQRFMLARIYMLKPKLIVADEPVSMLDASLRAMFLDNLKEFVQLGMSCLYITHDLNIAYFIADRIVILCNGRVVEEGATESVVKDPLHPYTQELIASIPTPDPRRRWKDQLTAEKIGLHKLREETSQNECVFVGRCPHAMPRCSRENPQLFEVEDREHQDREVACFLYTASRVPAGND
jgi:oligopeptide/dipeptide ABC transporter ATP-binding protein